MLYRTWMLALWTSCMTCLATWAQAQPAPGLVAEYTYNPINRQARITIASPRSFGKVTLALMDFEGQLLADPVDVHPGIVDLAEHLPTIWQLRRTAYLQLLDVDRPVGNALVLQPMLSRMVPVTEVKPHPVRGTLHSRITGWMDENEPVMQAPPASKTESPEPKTQGPPVERLCTGLRMYPELDAVLHTSHGNIRFAMKADEAPNTVWNFLELARGGFYRDIQFHRIVPLTSTSPPHPFVVQAGDPTATGDGGPGYWLPIENSALPHDFGVISMARSDDPDSNGSQFFIALSREGTARLDGQYCAFGYAVEGAAVIMEIAQVPLADVATGRPVNSPIVRNIELTPAPPRTPGHGRPDQRVTPESPESTPKPSGKIPR